MGRKRKHVDYRQLYKEHYGIEFDQNMAVHHIDFDRSNNNIDNLLLMPRSLHQKYHFAVNCLQGTGTGVIHADVKLGWNQDVSSVASRFKTLYEALHGLEPWILYKMQLDMNIERERMDVRENYHGRS